MSSMSEHRSITSAGDDLWVFLVKFLAFRVVGSSSEVSSIGDEAGQTGTQLGLG